MFSERNQSGQPSKEPSREKAISDKLLAGGLGNSAAKEAKLEQQVAIAIASLDQLQQEVINRRFGLGAQTVQSYKDIAKVLTASLTPELREQLAKERNIPIDQVAISVEEVREIEVAALRGLYLPKSPKGK